MNTIKNCLVEYISPSKTIEIVSSKFNDDLIYIYNYEGNHFRVFTEILNLVKFFQYNIEPKYSFNSEIELDNFINETFKKSKKQNI